MSDSKEKQQDQQQSEKQPDVVLIAHLQAHLLSGEVLQLLPIRHENDVKSDVTKLLEDWAKSGFLLRGNTAYPWHQVRSVEVTQIEELSPSEVHQRLMLLKGAERAQMQQGFWKTREVSKDDKDKKDGDSAEGGKKDDSKDDKSEEGKKE